MKQEEKLTALLLLSSQMGLEEELMVSLYLVFGDDMFFFFDLLAGKSLKVPSKRLYLGAMRKAEDYRVIPEFAFIGQQQEMFENGSYVSYDGSVYLYDHKKITLSGSQFLLGRKVDHKGFTNGK